MWGAGPSARREAALTTVTLAVLALCGIAACEPHADSRNKATGAESAGVSAGQRVFGRTRPASPDVFRFANQAEPELLDPGLMSGQADGRIARALFEGLVTQHPRTLEPQPGVAERWEITPDGRTYTFHLRHDARWTNGEPVTARDFEWSWRRVLHPDTPSRYADLFYLLRNGQAYKKREITDPNQVGVQALDDSTLHVELVAATPYFLQLVTYSPFMSVHRATVEKFGDCWTRSASFRMGHSGSKYRPNDRIEMVRNLVLRDVSHVRLKRIIAYSFGRSHDDAQHVSRRHDRLEPERRAAGAVHPVRAQLRRFPRRAVPGDVLLFVQRHEATVRRCPRAARSGARHRPREDHDVPATREQVAVGQHRVAGLRVLSVSRVCASIRKRRAALAGAGYPDGRGFPHRRSCSTQSQDHRKIAEARAGMWKREQIDWRSRTKVGSYMKATTSARYRSRAVLDRRLRDEHVPVHAAKR
jgi:oligopeptide transport system substrate-binding protein